jgi:hypothetical protein
MSVSIQKLLMFSIATRECKWLPTTTERRKWDRRSQVFGLLHQNNNTQKIMSPIKETLTTARTRNIQRSNRSAESVKHSIHDRQQSADTSRQSAQMNFVLIIVVGTRDWSQTVSSMLTMDIAFWNTLDYGVFCKVSRVVVIGCRPLFLYLSGSQRDEVELWDGLAGWQAGYQREAYS